MIDWISSIFLIAGGFFGLIAGLGLLRFPDLLSRMHAATKASGAAFSLILVAFVLRLPEWHIAIKAIISLFLAFLTLPVAAHLLGRNTSIQEESETAPKPKSPTSGGTELEE